MNKQLRKAVWKFEMKMAESQNCCEEKTLQAMHKASRAKSVFLQTNTIEELNAELRIIYTEIAKWLLRKEMPNVRKHRLEKSDIRLSPTAKSGKQRSNGTNNRRVRRKIRQTHHRLHCLGSQPLG